MRRVVSVPLKLLVGGALTQTVFGAIVVFGWLQRWTQRSAFRAWWGQSASGEARAGAVLRDPLLREHVHAPNWVLAQNFGTHLCEGRGWMGGWLGSLRENLRLGVQGAANTLVLSLPGSVLMSLGWWGGWQNSFHKGYEQFHVGPAVFITGMLLFLAAVFYVPMALARQAVTGRWRAFWEWRTVWRVIRHAWIGCAALALLFAVFNLGAVILKTWPYFLPQMKHAQRMKSGAVPSSPEAGAFQLRLGDIDWNNLSEAEALMILNRHFLVSGLICFVSLLVLRMVAGRVYAGAMLRAVQSGTVGEEQLGEREWRLLHCLDLLKVRPAPERPMVVRIAAWAAGRTARFLCGGAVLVFWFAFLAEVIVSEFFSRHPIIGFLNHPLLQLPWFRYVPAHLQSPWGELGFTVVALGGFGLLTIVKSPSDGRAGDIEGHDVAARRG
jgi:hypothetical protein